jgi:CRISPR-associated protein Cas2
VALNAQQNFLLAYDIADPARLVRVHRKVRRHGIPLQYSVFLVPTTVPGLLELVDDLHALIDERVDDVRVYPLPATLEVVYYGRQALPEGVDLVAASPSIEGISALVGRSPPQ